MKRSFNWFPGAAACVFILLLATGEVFATHLRAADVQVERICGTLTFKITVVAYMNTNSSTRFGTNSQVYFGDGSSINIPTTLATLRPDLGTDISVATFTTTHTYGANGTYTISYIERDRSAGVLNIDDSEDTPYVTFVTINTDPSFGCNRFPVLSVIPLDRACSGVAFFHSSGAYDTDGDSLSYEMSIPASSITTRAVYTAPNDRKFYTNYAQGNEENNAPPSFFINALTGLVTWDAPGLLGEYNIAFKIIEWRKLDDGSYRQISSTTRDMQIVVEECENTRPELIVPNDTCVVAGTEINALIKGLDVENHPVKIEVFSELLLLASNPATYTPEHTDFVPSLPPAEIAFNWQTGCEHIRQQPYQIVFKITDDPPDGPKLVTFKTWSIRVVAPAPEWDTVSLDVVNHYGILSMESFACDNIHSFQIWRKVDSNPYVPGYCETGIRSGSGYQLIDVIPGTTLSYTDTNFGNGLSPGARYCYRIVGLVKDTKSYVSEEMCIGPVKADAPVITHVSVEKTAAEDGRIRVSWRSPFDIDKSQFPEPYEYEIYRATGFIGDTSIVKAGYVNDTTFLDTSVNTLDKVFNYRIVIYSKPVTTDIFIPVDTSAAASSVRLAGIAGAGGVTLQWRDSVPWSNVVTERPYHLIMRGEEADSDESTMEVVDSVNVLLDRFTYDDPSANENKIYTYKIVTRGTYGNPEIALQENLSQRVSVYPLNNFQPCAPVVTIQETDCGQYLGSYTCNDNIFSNVIQWNEPSSDSECRIDIVAYNIYTSTDPTGEFQLLTTLDATVFTDGNLTSMAKCYKVSAVDSRGIESPLSEMVCNDNCPYFELPNVFTPNGDSCNDLFSTAYDRDDQPQNTCQPVDPNKCPRFVLEVDATIFNRWGQEVYHTNSAEGGSLYIEWDGHDNNGTECSMGIYYFTVNVTFDVLQPAERKQTFKGWVSLVR